MPRGWPLILAVAVFLVCVAAAVRAAMAVTGGHLIYAVDDAYIHMAMAKNLARHGVWGCTPFHFSSSSSSLLWTLVLGVSSFLVGVHDVTPLVLNIVFAMLTLAAADYYLKRFSAPPILRAAALVGLVIAFPMPGMVLLGMEHVLHLLLTIVFAGMAVEALTGSDAEAVHRRRQTIALSVVGALLGASRYEGFFLVGLVCLAFLARRQVLRGFIIGAAAFLPVAIFGVIALANGALFFPNSLMLKAGGESASALSVLFKPIGRDDLALFQNNRGLTILAVLGLLAALAQSIRQRSVWQPQVLIPLLLSLMIAAHAHFAFSSTFWLYRYDAYLVGFGIFAVAAVLAGQRPLLPALAVAGVVAVVANVRTGLVPEGEIAGAANTYLEHYQTAQFIKRYYADQTVVVNDLGAVTYFTETRILDIVGLGDIEPVNIRRETGDYTRADVQAWTARYQPAIGIVQLNWSWVVPRVPAAWIKMAEVEVPPHGQRIGFFAVKPEAARALRNNVEDHYGRLGDVAGYRLHLF